MRRKIQAGIISGIFMAKSNHAFELKGSLFTLTVMHLFTTDLGQLTQQLIPLVKQTPKFFQHMPIVVDLQKLSSEKNSIDFAHLAQTLMEQGLILVGIRGGTAKQNEAALQANLAVFPNTKTEVVEKPAADETSQQTQTETASTTTATTLSAKIITQPVRSGQQIYARNADLIVLAPVSPGAELLADGNIHVYSALRGRALAGVTGDENCRIFCQSLEAELVSIAGHYWISEDLQNASIKQNAHIYLENDRLHIGAF